MADNFYFELVSAEQLLFSAMIRSVVLPSSCGQMTVMANHAPAIVSIKPGLLNIELDSGKSIRYMLFKGFVNIVPTQCIVLAENSILLEDCAVSTLDQRITALQDEINDAEHHHHRLQLEQFLMDIEHLRNSISRE